MKRLKKLIFSGISILGVAAVLVTFLWDGNMQVAQAATRMYGVQEIVEQMNEGSSFVMLEIISDESQASLGYYVEGEEPNIAPELLAACISSKERAEAADAYLSKCISDGLISEMIYEEQLLEPEDLTGWSVIDFDAPVSEVRNGYYDEAVEHGVEYGDYTESEDYEYTPGNGTHVWIDDSQNGTEQDVTFEKLYYKTQVESSDLFAQAVLETEDSNIKVYSLTPTQVEEALEYGVFTWDQIDLLYLSASNCLSNVSDEAYEADNDLSWRTAFNIYKYAVESKLPVVVDGQIVSAEGAAQLNVGKLAALLVAYTEETTMDTFGLTSEDAQWSEETSAAVANALSGKTGYDYWVAGNVVTVSENFVNPRLANTIYNTKDASSSIHGVENVVAELEKENFYNEINGSGFTSEVADDKSLNISLATLVKYILNYGYRRVEVQKESIRVLDIEPTKYSELTEEKILSWLGESGEAIKEIHIDQMTMSEFIGKMVDLNETYDLIYLGSCIGDYFMTGAMNISLGSDKTTEYNDEKLNGLIYSSTGDKTVVSEAFAGLLASDYNEDESIKEENITTRYSGNDITERKAAELQEFADSAYPIVVSAAFFNDDDTVNVSRVEAGSNLEKFLSACAGKSNVMQEDGIAAATLAQYLNMLKLDLALVSAPEEYDVSFKEDDGKEVIETITSLDVDDETGKYELEYSFEISNLSGSVGDATSYKAQLFVDENADGQFSDEEELHQLKIEDDNGNSVASAELKTGVRYELTRELSSETEGIVAWKLQVSLATADGSESSVRDSRTGCTFIRPKKAIAVNVLQLAASDDGLDLSTNKEIQRLFEDLRGQNIYDVTVEVRPVSQYLKDFSNANMDEDDFYESYFAAYDMLVIGAEDGYAEKSYEGFSEKTVKDAVDVLEIFVESGKAVVFTHDTTSHKLNNKNEKTWGYYLNRMIRSNAGMDRYGILSAGEDHVTGAAGDGFKHKEGFSNVLLDGKSYSLYDSLFYYNIEGILQLVNTTTAISQVNEGQITSYPYDVNLDMEGDRTVKTAPFNSEKEYLSLSHDTMSVASTQAQYYQLDLEDEDLIVWYSLADDVSTELNAYAAMPNDVRNSYFIYSINNVTYTGTGNSDDITDEEAKLFVNTMIAAYNLGIKNPTIDILAEENNLDSSLDRIYRNYDEDMNLDETDETIYYYIHDKNIIHGTKDMQVNYYYEVEEKAEDVKEILYEGKTVYLRKIDPAMKEDLLDVSTGGVYHVLLTNGWIKEKFKEDYEINVYIGVQTKLNFTDPERTEETAEIFDMISIRKRELFNLD